MNKWQDFSSRTNKNDLLKNAEDLLIRNRIEFVKLTPTQWRVGNHNFWPTTGLFIDIKTDKRNTGIQKLINKLKG